MNKLATLIITLQLPFSVPAQELIKSEIIALKGQNTYYEVYGQGEHPLFMLHGYGSSSKDWYEFVKDFEDDFTVYAVDLQGHGKSASFQADWSMYSVAENFIDLLEYLNLEGVCAIGFSYGGDILFQTAAINQSAVKRIVTIGSIGTWNAKDYPDYIDYFSYSNIDNLKWMDEFQIDESQTRAILDYFANYRVELSDEQLKGIQSELLIVLGDDDSSIPLNEVARVREQVPKSYLWVMPNTGHGAHKDKYRKDFIKTSKAFFLSD